MMDTLYSTHYGNDWTTEVILEETLNLIAKIRRETPVIVTTKTWMEELQDKFPARAFQEFATGGILYGFPVEVYATRAECGKRCMELMENDRKTILLLDKGDA